MTTDQRIGKTVCWCGREWAVPSLKAQCERGDHMEVSNLTDATKPPKVARSRA